MNYPSKKDYPCTLEVTPHEKIKYHDLLVSLGNDYILTHFADVVAECIHADRHNHERQ